IQLKPSFLKQESQSSFSKLLKKVYKKIFARLWIYGTFEETLFLNKNAKYDFCEIGDYTYGHPTGSPEIIYFGENVKLSIGKFCSFAADVKLFLGGQHRVDW